MPQADLAGALTTALQDIVSHIARQRVDQFMPPDEALFGPLQEARALEDDHWIARASLAATWLDLEFECHFSTAMARRLARGVVGELEVAPADCHSLLAEYTNVTLGTLRSRLRAVLSDVGGGDVSELVPTLELPTVQPSFDRCSAFVDHDQAVRTTWRLVTLHGELILSSTVSLRIDELTVNSSLPLSSVCGLISDLKAIVREDRSEHDFRRTRSAA